MKIVKKASEKLRNLSIGYKLVLLVYLSALVLFILLTAALYIRSREIALEEFVSSHLRICSSGNQLVDEERSYMLGVAEYYSLASDIQSILMASNSGNSAGLPNAFLDSVSQRRNLSSMTFYTTRGRPVDFISIDNSSCPLPQSTARGTIFYSLISGESSLSWEFIPEDSERYMQIDNSPKLCLWYPVHQSHSAKVIGVIAVTMDSRKLLSTGVYVDSLYDQLFILDTESHSTVVNHTVASLSTEEQSRLVQQVGSQDQGYFVEQIQGQRYYVFYSKVANTSLIIYLISPYSWGRGSVTSLLQLFLGGIVCFQVLLFPVLLLITKYLIRPLRILRDTMLAFSDGQFDAHIHFKYNDEIGDLGRVFNQMVARQQDLMEQAVSLRIKKQEAELSTLQAQINPHFLYNVLNAIQWEALRHREEEIADMAYSLSQVFRISLNRGSDFTTGEEEYSLVRYYLSLQNRRYGDRISYSLTCDPESRQCKIPKLIIQPLVENSIVHGAENISTNVHIAITATLEEGRLTIVVADNGCGISREVLEALSGPGNLETSEKEHSSGSRYAIKNIRERLQLIYGKKAEFCMESSPGKGTRTTIHILIPDKAAPV